MSRRKQSNPKPIKRKSEDEDLHLPPGILQSGGGKDSEDPAIRSVIALPRGSSFGPFKGHVIDDIGERDSENVIQLNRLGGTKVWLKLEAEEGNWLKHVVTSSDGNHNIRVSIQGVNIWVEVTDGIGDSQKLVAVFWNSSDEREENSLTDTDTREQDTHSSPLASPPSLDEAKGSIVAPPTSAISHGTKQLHPLIYGCQFCGVRFSNSDTLEAHQTYYCAGAKSILSEKESEGDRLEEVETTKEREKEEEKEVQRGLQEATLNIKEERPASEYDRMTEERLEATVQANLHNALKSKQMKRELEFAEPDEELRGAELELQPPEKKSAKVRVQHQCQLCSYTSGRLSAMRRHICSQHPQLNEDENTLDPAYCRECEIQFSSVKTLLAHKEFYCERRQQEKNRGSQSVDTCSTSSASQSPLGTQVSPRLLPGNVSANVTTTIVEAASQHLVAGGPISPSVSMPVDGSNIHTQVIIAAPVVSPDGRTNVTLAVPTVIMQPIIAAPNMIQAHQNSTTAIMSRATKSNSSVQDVPLDLSMKNKPVSFGRDSRKDHASPVCRSVPAPAETLTKSLPQGVSKCMECNIVFYKHENYLIHKEHYCSSRHQRLSSEAATTEYSYAVTSGIAAPNNGSQPNPNSRVEHNDRPLSTPNNNDAASQKLLQHLSVLRFACVPCNIRFSTSRTLMAHTQHYCPHSVPRTHDGIGIDDHSVDSMQPEQPEGFDCQSCKKIFPSMRLLRMHSCNRLAQQTSTLRCGYCDYIASSESRLSEHLKIHAPQRIYKCTVCGYRGNTIRGMRMHGKMHVDSGESFTDDNIVCFEEPPVLPINECIERNQQQTELSENDLIRLKNEPYKRRRSRKSFEKSEHMTPRKIFTCEHCNTDFTDKGRYKLHLLAHSEDRTDLVQELRGPNSSLANRLQNDKLAAKSKGSEHIKNMLFSKPEANEAIQSSSSGTLPDQENVIPTSMSNDSRKVCLKIPMQSRSPSGCNGDDDSFVVSVKEEPVDADEHARVTPLGNGCNYREPVDRAVQSVKVHPGVIHLPAMGGAHSVIPKNDLLSERVCKNDAEQVVGNETETNASLDSDTVRLIDPGDLGGRFCQKCNISFRYFASYVAHKKYYCDSHPPGNHVSSSIHLPIEYQHVETVVKSEYP